jgi:hypothetical protein
MIATIDFEASGTSGYPIEVGVAIHTPGNQQISVWSSLIKPTAAWLEAMTWDPAAAKIHGITRQDIETAPTAWDVAIRLNALLAPCGVAYCDGWRYDHRWLFLLMQECPETCAFELHDISQLGRRLDVPPSTLFERDNDSAAHRAGPDAEALLRRALAAKPNN